MRAMHTDNRNAVMVLLAAAAVAMLMLAYAPGLQAEDQGREDRQIGEKLQGFDAAGHKVFDAGIVFGLRSKFPASDRTKDKL